MSGILNPGTGSCSDATEENAIENMKHFLVDCGVKGLHFVRIPELDFTGDYFDGRFVFLIWRGTRCHEIRMPGLPLERVRYTSNDLRNIWDFPRLYVDGSSWVWCYALLDGESFNDGVY